MDLLPASGFPIHSENLPVRIGAIEIVNVDERYGVGRLGSFQDLIFECDAFRIVFLEPRFRGIEVCKDLDVVDVADLLARIHVDEHGHLTIL
jgi:hypothetical protein